MPMPMPLPLLHLYATSSVHFFSDAAAAAILTYFSSFSPPLPSEDEGVLVFRFSPLLPSEDEGEATFRLPNGDRNPHTVARQSPSPLLESSPDGRSREILTHISILYPSPLRRATHARACRSPDIDIACPALAAMEPYQAWRIFPDQTHLMHDIAIGGQSDLEHHPQPKALVFSDIRMSHPTKSTCLGASALSCLCFHFQSNKIIL
ncbi:hypothetical protein ACLOJK_031610 [Asimina triloba]